MALTCCELMRMKGTSPRLRLSDTPVRQAISANHATVAQIGLLRASERHSR
jgi:hypothetical protein